MIVPPSFLSYFLLVQTRVLSPILKKMTSLSLIDHPSNLLNRIFL